MSKNRPTRTPKSSNEEYYLVKAFFDNDWLFEKAIPEPNSGCFIHTSFQYGAHSVSCNFQVVMLRFHRISWILSNDRPIPEGLHICHSCDNPSCINPGHLFPGTRSENAKDMVKKRRNNPRKPKKYWIELYTNK